MKCVCCRFCVCVCVLDHSWAADTGLVERAVVNRASMVAGLLTVDLSASLRGNARPWHPSPEIGTGGAQLRNVLLHVQVRRRSILRHKWHVSARAWRRCASHCRGHRHHHPFSQRHFHVDSLRLLWREIQEGMIGWDKFIRQLSVSAVIYQSIPRYHVPFILLSSSSFSSSLVFHSLWYGHIRHFCVFGLCVAHTALTVLHGVIFDWVTAAVGRCFTAQRLKF